MRIKSLVSINILIIGLQCGIRITKLETDRHRGGIAYTTTLE